MFLEPPFNDRLVADAACEGDARCVVGQLCPEDACEKFSSVLESRN
jgi:hypothetical protein